MRDETSEWLNPMLDAAGDNVDVRALMLAATMPAAEADTPLGSWLAKMTTDADLPSSAHRSIDWVRFGQLLRHELGWDDTYPALPDYPETRDRP